MPAYLVQMDADAAAATRVEGVDSIVVFAANATDARDFAAAKFTQDSDSAWDNAATVTEIIAAATLAGFNVHSRFSGGAGVVDEKGTSLALDGTQDAINAVAIDGGGTGYSTNDILTIGNPGPGVFSRVCRLRVTSQAAGVIDGIEVIDPGLYTTLPTPLTAMPVTGGSGGDDATFDLTADGIDGMDVLAALWLASLENDLNVAAPEYDSTTNVITIPAAENLGDVDMVAEVRWLGRAVTGLNPTINAKGAQASIRTFTLAADAVVIPNHWAEGRLVF